MSVSRVFPGEVFPEAFPSVSALLRRCFPPGQPRVFPDPPLPVGEGVGNAEGRFAEGWGGTIR